jgi:exonuclease SbcC
MRPLELSLAGFTSFRDEQHLDFSQLDLFAITGPTGAGKSSLLDAITYALYGKTARTGSQIQEMVSQGASLLKVQLRFAMCQGEYRVTRLWRDRGKTTVTSVLLEVYQKNKWETLETKERSTNQAIEQILGMDFDTFTRVILLPQGQFDEFLKGNTTKRREILRQLAGFEIFEMMRKEANNLAGLFKKELEAVERQINELEAPPDWELEQKLSQLLALENDLPRLNEAVWQAQKKLDEEQQLFERLARLLKLHQELAELNLNTDEIEALEKRLERSQTAAFLQGDWTLVQSARHRAKIAENQAISSAKKLQKIQAQLKRETEKLDGVKAAVAEMLPQFKARSEALATVQVYEQQQQQIAQELVRLQKILLAKTTELAAAQKEWQKMQVQNTAAEQQVKKITVELEKYPPVSDRLETLKQLSPLLMEWQLIDQQAKKQLQQQKILQEQLEVSQFTVKEAQFHYQFTQKEMEESRVALAEAEAINSEVTRLNQAAVLRESLISGTICPVCGGVYHPDRPLPDLEIVEWVDVLPLRDRLQTHERQFQQAQRQLAQAETALEQKTQQLTACDRELSEVQNQLGTKYAAICSYLTAEELSANFPQTVQHLKQEYEELQGKDRRSKQVQQQHQVAVAHLNQTRQALEFTAKTHQQAQKEEQMARSEVDRQLEARQNLRTTLAEITGGFSYEQLRQNLTREQQQLQTQLEQAEQTYQKIHRAAIAAETEDRQAKGIQQTALDQEKQLNTYWVEKLKTANFTEAEFLNAQLSIPQQSAWQKQIRDYRSAKITLETRFEDLRAEIGDRTTDEEILKHCHSSLKNAQKQLKQASDRRTELTVWIQVSQSKIQQLNVLESQQESLKEQAETYHTLAQNLKNNEFQAYILEHLEAELLARATVLLQELSDARYKLTIEHGEYWVEDNWNGGEKRRVRTLSGGETFAASLSMALALSERLSMGADLGSLFLDEGFGTLDAETLEGVTQILESLRQRSRMIGVITHVRDLAERLPTQIRVYKSPSGSRLELEML